MVYNEQGKHREYISPISLNDTIDENMDLSLDNLIDIDNDDIFDNVKMKMDMEIIRKAIERLPILQQTTLKLKYLMDLNYEEISEVTGRSKDAVYKSICLGSKMLAIEVFNDIFSKEKLKGMLHLVPDEFDREILRLFAENKSFNEIAKSVKEKGT